MKNSLSVRADPKELKQLVDNNWGEVLNLCYGTLGADEDLQQEFYAHLMSGVLPKYNPQYNLTTYLRWCAHNFKLHYLRAQRIRKRGLERYAQLNRSVECNESDGASLIAQELLENVSRLIFKENLPITEVSKILNIPASTLTKICKQISKIASLSECQRI